MKREQLSDIIANLDDRHIAEAAQFDPVRRDSAPERILPMKKKRIVTFALAAALLLMLAMTAFAAVRYVVEHRWLKESLALQEQAILGADALQRFAGGSYTADSDALHEAGDQGQSDATMFFYNDRQYLVQYYQTGELHMLDARAAYETESPEDSAYWEQRYPDAEDYKAKMEAAVPEILDHLHEDSWIGGDSSGAERIYCNARCRFMGNCAVCHVLMTDGTAYELWLQPETFAVEGFMYFNREDTPNTRNGFFTALHTGTEEAWFDALQNNPDGLG